MSDITFGSFTHHDQNRNDRIDSGESFSFSQGDQVLQSNVPFSKLCHDMESAEKSTCRKELKGFFDQMGLSFSQRSPHGWYYTLKKAKDFTTISFRAGQVVKIQDHISKGRFLEAWKELDNFEVQDSPSPLNIKKVYAREFKNLQGAITQALGTAIAQGNNAKVDSLLLVIEQIYRDKGKGIDEPNMFSILAPLPEYLAIFKLSRQAEPLVRQGKVQEVKKLTDQMTQLAAGIQLDIKVRTEGLNRRAQRYREIHDGIAKGLPPRGPKETSQQHIDRYWAFYDGEKGLGSEYYEILSDENGGAGKLLREFHRAKLKQALDQFRKEIGELKTPGDLNKARLYRLSDHWGDADHNIEFTFGDQAYGYKPKSRELKLIERQLDGLARSLSRKIVSLSKQGMTQCNKSDDKVCQAYQMLNEDFSRALRGGRFMEYFYSAMSNLDVFD